MAAKQGSGASAPRKPGSGQALPAGAEYGIDEITIVPSPSSDDNLRVTATVTVDVPRTAIQGVIDLVLVALAQIARGRGLDAGEQS